MSRLPVSTVVKLVSSVPYSISYCGLPLGSLGGSQLSSKPSERMRVTDNSRGTEGTVHSRMLEHNLKGTSIWGHYEF